MLLMAYVAINICYDLYMLRLAYAIYDILSNKIFTGIGSK